MNLNTITSHTRHMYAHAAILFLAMLLCFSYSFHTSAAGASNMPQPAYAPAGVSQETMLPSGPAVMDLTYIDYGYGSAPQLQTANVPLAYPSTYYTAMPATMLTGTTLHTDLDLDALFGGVIDVILKMAMYIGGALAASGVFQLLLSYYNDQPEGKAAALRLVVVGGAMMGMRGLLEVIGLIG